MVDMHVGLEDRVEHRVTQQGFVPGSPLGAASPGAINRAYYGFPGDGDVAPPAPERQQQPSYSMPDERDTSRDTNRGRKDSIKKKKKGGLRGFLSKLAGGGGSSSAILIRLQSRLELSPFTEPQQRAESARWLSRPGHLA
jgi:hypothetical protein